MPDSLAVAFGRELAHLGTSPLEVVGFVATVANVALLARNRVLGWPVGLVAIVAYGVVFFGAKLYADTLLQAFFFATSLWGWVDWNHGGAAGPEGRTERPVTRLSRRGWIVALVAIAATSALLGGGFHLFTDAARPFLDSALTGASVVAQVLLMRRVLDTWLIWIVADVLYVPLYLSRDLPLTALLYAGLCVLALRGYLGWRRVEGTADPA